MSVLRAGAHECQIRSAPVLVLPRLQRFSITLKRRQRTKINFILALCQQSKIAAFEQLSFFEFDVYLCYSSLSCFWIYSS
ncbi:hypothetical protein CTV99_08235 [Bacillus pumilus]|uniref:Uncharacterized protein n=1 Tax=Bacillus pumilus TaxID=1408 RepID=A0A2G8IV18_BACPU|nr:hypothetical protein CTV99_08235 [Bacillus pumilus]